MDFEYDLSMAVWYLDQIEIDCTTLAPFYASLARYHLLEAKKKIHFNETLFEEIRTE